MPQAGSFIFLLFFILLSFPVFSQESDNTYDKIRRSVEQKNYPDAISELKSLQRSNPKIFAANNYDYLLARLSEKTGDFADASANYQLVVKRDSILKEYALWHLSQIMRSSGNLLMERLYLQELSLTADKSLLKTAVIKRFPRSLMESGNFAEAIKFVSRQTSVVGRTNDETVLEEVKEILFDKISREDLVLLGNAYLQTKQTDKAREIFNELVNNPPKANQPDDFALAGAKGLDLLESGEENFGKSVSNLNAEEHFKRAEIYQFNRNFPFARLHYEAIVNNHKENNKVVISMYNIGRGFGQERNDEKAVEWFERLQKEFPDDDLATSALYSAAGAYANLNKTNEAVSRYLKYLDENPDADNLERALLNVVDAYRDENNPRAALEWTAKMREKFAGETGDGLALFAQAKIHLSQENWRNALNDLNALANLKKFGGNIAGGTNKEEVEFLRGFVLEKLGRFDEAIEIYLSIDDGLKNFYGWRATERIKGVSENIILQKHAKYSAQANETLTDTNAEQIKTAAHKAFRLTIDAEKKKEIQARISRTYQLLKDYQKIPGGNLVEFGRRSVLAESNKTRTHKAIADELLFLGLFDEATPELETALRENLDKNTGSLSDFPPDTAYTLAVFYKRGDMANRAVGYTEALWRKTPNDYQLELIPREQLELLYPKPYQDSLVKFGKEKRVDPRFMLSIMRQESRFQADVKSIAAARGLMQFISTTAELMAQEMQIEDFRQDDLYNPPTAIRFGSHYIAKIFKDFPNQPEAVAASYNAGEDRMMRWKKRANTDDADRYVPEVVFVQTKDYVHKVMANYRIYQMLYDENLNNSERRASLLALNKRLFYTGNAGRLVCPFDERSKANDKVPVFDCFTLFADLK